MEREGWRRRGGTVNRLNHKNSHICFYDILLWRVEAFMFYDCTAIATVEAAAVAVDHLPVEQKKEKQREMYSVKKASFVAVAIGSCKLLLATSPASKLASWHCHDRDTPTYLIYRYTFHFSKAAPPRCVCVKGEKANANG